MLHGGAVFQAARELETDYREILDFSANINPFGCPETVKKAMAESLNEAAYYPDPDQQDLRDAIGKREQVPVDWIYAGNGAAELIFRLCFGIKPETALVCAPTFLEYEKALRASKARIIRSFLSENENFTPGEDYIMRLKQLRQGDMAFICNPNNPTGQLIPGRILLKIAETARNQGVYLVIDECFLDFTKEYPSNSMKGFLGRYENIILLKSFTKMFALPGIRIGYVLTADPCLIERSKAAGQDWGISCVARAAGAAACREEAYAAWTAGQLAVLRRELTEGLKKLGFRVIEGEANYVLFQAGQKNLEEKLMKNRILIRSCANYPGLDRSWYRSAVRSREDNQRLLRALGEE